MNQVRLEGGDGFAHDRIIVDLQFLQFTVSRSERLQEAVHAQSALDVEVALFAGEPQCGGEDFYLVAALLKCFGDGLAAKVEGATMQWRIQMADDEELHFSFGR